MNGHPNNQRSIHPVRTLLTLLLMAAGSARQAQGLTATGGSVAHYVQNGTNFTAHIYTNSGAFEVVSGGRADVLIVGGGGGGGGKAVCSGGGGGGGGTGGAGGSGIVIVRYAAFSVQNQPVSDVTGTSATLSGLLHGIGGSAASVCLLWGEESGGNTWEWARSDWFAGSNWTDNTPLRKTLPGLAKDRTYFYTFGAKHAGGNTLTEPPVAFITGEVTIEAGAQASETGAGGVPVPASIAVSRPAACANAPLTVAYAVSGTASNGTDYTKLNGTITLPAGGARVDIVVEPWNDMTVEGDETVTVTLLPGPYVIGAANAATVTIADTAVRSFCVSPDAVPAPPYDTWANGFTSLQASIVKMPLR